MENNRLIKNFVPTSEFYSQVIESLQDYAIITVDKELHINSWSSGASKLLGYKNEEVLGKHKGLIFVNEDKIMYR